MSAEIPAGSLRIGDPVKITTRGEFRVRSRDGRMVYVVCAEPGRSFAGWFHLEEIEPVWQVADRIVLVTREGYRFPLALYENGWRRLDRHCGFYAISQRAISEAWAEGRVTRLIASLVEKTPTELEPLIDPDCRDPLAGDSNG